MSTAGEQRLSWPVRRLKDICLLAARLCMPRPKAFTSILYWLVWLRARSLGATEGARFVLALEARLYPLMGLMAVEYGGGVHTKHRHTGYHDFFVERLGPDDHVLDVGCGNGCLAHDIATRSGSRVTGIDVDRQHLAEAGRRFTHPRVEYFECDVTRGVPRQVYTAAVLSNVLEHIDDRSDLLRALAQGNGIHRFLIRVPCYERDWRVPLMEELGVDYRLDVTHRIEHRVEDFVEEAAGAGLEVRELLVRWGEIWAELVYA